MAELKGGQTTVSAPDVLAVYSNGAAKMPTTVPTSIVLVGAAGHGTSATGRSNVGANDLARAAAVGVGAGELYAHSMKTKEPLRVTEHLHTNVRDVAARTRRFGDSSHDTQLRVLKELRLDVAIDSTQPAFTVAALFLAFVAIVVPPAVNLDFQESPWWLTLIASSVLMVILGVVLLVVLLPLIKQHSSRAIATVWLAAYEDEISRWRSLDTRAGKAWRRTH